MASHRLPNYLRVHRKHLGLSQDEAAFLLGWCDASRPSCYEYFPRTPVLRTALAFAAIFRVSVYELFLSEHQQVENAVRRQAQRLAARLAAERPERPTTQKLATLKMIISSDANRL